jgi:hypothetical protein
MALTDIDGQRLGDSVADKLGDRNLIINGAMQVAQRGTSSTTSGYGSVDRYFVQWNDGTLTHTQTAITSGSPYEEGFRSILRLTNTSATTAAGSIKNCFQYIEAQNLANSGWNYASSSSYVTLSFWVRSSVAQEFYGYLRTFDGTEQGYSFSLGSLSANTWTKVTKIIPGNSNITIDNDNGTGLQLNISPFWGTDFTDSGVSVDTWGAFASGTRTPDYTNTWANTAGATFDLTGIQLEVGNTATPFQHRSYAHELQRCQRYFQVLGPLGRVPGAASSPTSLVFPLALATPLRATPSFVSNSVAQIKRYDSVNVSIGSASFSVGSFSKYKATIDYSVTGVSVSDNQSYWVTFTSLNLNAEL